MNKEVRDTYQNAIQFVQQSSWGVEKCIKIEIIYIIVNDYTTITVIILFSILRTFNMKLALNIKIK